MSINAQQTQDAAVSAARLWRVVLPEAASPLLSQGLSIGLVREMFHDDLDPHVMLAQLRRAVTQGRYERDEAAVLSFCENVVTACRSWHVTQEGMFNAVVASTVKIENSASSITRYVGAKRVYAPDSGRRWNDDALHQGYHLLTVLLPLATWWLLGLPDDQPIHPLFSPLPEDIAPAKQIATRAAAALAELLPVD